MLLRLADVATIEAATPLIGAVLAIAEADLPATGPGEFYAYQLEGFDVVTSGGDRLGTVDHLIPTGSNEVLVVRDEQTRCAQGGNRAGFGLQRRHCCGLPFYSRGRLVVHGQAARARKSACLIEPTPKT